MKRTFTFQTLMLSLLVMVLGNNLFAQTYNVPADFPTVSAAVEAIKADASITAGAEVTINVAEGVYDEETIVQVGKAIKLTIQGAGADKTNAKRS
jgi:pectin methylesterase-like acyl-CoA thioesterase